MVFCYVDPISGRDGCKSAPEEKKRAAQNTDEQNIGTQSVLVQRVGRSLRAAESIPEHPRGAQSKRRKPATPRARTENNYYPNGRVHSACVFFCLPESSSKVSVAHPQVKKESSNSHKSMPISSLRWIGLWCGSGRGMCAYGCTSNAMAPFDCQARKPPSSMATRCMLSH